LDYNDLILRMIYRTQGGIKPLIAPPAPDIHLMGLSSSHYVLKTLKDIRPSELDEALLILPFPAVVTFFRYLECWAREGREVELVARCLFFLLRIYQPQIGATKDLRNVLLSLQKHIRTTLQAHKAFFPWPSPPLSHSHSLTQSLSPKGCGGL